MQTLDLAGALPNARFDALDGHPDYLKELELRAQEAGVAERITTHLADMHELPFESGSFDLIWCEGAAYIMGVENALRSWKKFLKPEGRLAFTDAVWLTDSPSEMSRELWEMYDDLGPIDARRVQIAKCGYNLLGDFVLPPETWWDDYYTPLELRLRMLEKKYAGNDIAGDVLAECQREIDTHRAHPDEYSYAFFILSQT